MVSPAKRTTLEEAQAQLDRLLGELQRTGGEIVVTRDGRPIGRLAPMTDPQGRPLEPLKGTVRRYDDPFGPAL